MALSPTETTTKGEYLVLVTLEEMMIVEEMMM